MAQSFTYLRCLALGFAVWSLGSTAVPANAQTKRSYAVLSLAADSLNVIERAASTGSQIDRNNRQRIAISDDTFEVAVLRSVRDALNAGGDVALFTTRDPRLFALQERALDSDELPPELTTAVGELVAKSKATHLILVTKHSASVSIPFRDGHAGDGKLSGLGFYLDRDMRINSIDTGEISTGFIAPFASMEVTLIDTKTMRTVRHVHANRAKAFPAAVSNTAGVPWDILTPSQKVKSLIEVIEAALQEAVPKVVAAD